MRGGDQVSFPPTWIANGSSTIYWKIYSFCTEVHWHLCCKSNDNMCVRLCLYSILFHFSIFENLSTNTTCHSDLLAIIANWKIFTAFTCRAIFHYLVSAQYNLNFLPWHPHPRLWKPSSSLTVPWSQWPPFTCCAWLSYQGPHTHSARQSIWLPYLPCSFLFINYAPVKCHLLCEAFQSKLDSLPTLYIFSWHHNL